VAGVHGDPGPFEASCELLREQNLRELRLTVRAEAAVSPIALEVVEMDRAARVGARGDVDDARRRGLLEEVEQQVRQQKSGKIVDLERSLEAVRRDLAMRRVDAGVIDEDIEPRILPLEFLREGPDRGLTREIDDFEEDPRVSRLAQDLLSSSLPPRGIPARHHNGAAQSGETHRGRLADSGVRAGHEEYAFLDAHGHLADLTVDPRSQRGLRFRQGC